MVGTGHVQSLIARAFSSAVGLQGRSVASFSQNAEA